MITINLEAIGMFILKSLITVTAVTLAIAVPSAMIYDETDNDVAEKVATIAVKAFIVSMFELAALMFGALLFKMLFELWGL